MTDRTFRQLAASGLVHADPRLRRRADPEMPRAEELLETLWEIVVENRPPAMTRAAELQGRRERVKARHPKDGPA